MELKVQYSNGRLSINYIIVDIALLHEREDWRVQAEDSGCITSLVRNYNYCVYTVKLLVIYQPLLFENIVVEVLITLKEVVIENQPGESQVRMLSIIS